MNRKKGFRWISIVFTILIVIVRISGMFRSDDSPSPNPVTMDDSGYESSYCSEKQNEYREVRQTLRSWRDYYSEDYCITYTTARRAFSDTRDYRNRMQPPDAYSRSEHWHDIYSMLYEQDYDYVTPLTDSLFKLKQKNQLDRDEFADMIVTFVQDIPYSYVLDMERCQDQDDPMHCIQDERFGLLSPIEFMHSLYGDCDTRTLLLYTIFKHFNYEPVIVNSWVYMHSMLLLDVGGNGGAYLKKNGKRYYFWETTATGWMSGQMPPDMGNLESWEVILD